MSAPEAPAAQAGIDRGTPVERLDDLSWTGRPDGVFARAQDEEAEFPRGLSVAEHSPLLQEWNRTERDYPRDHCIHQLFEAQAQFYR